VKVIKVSPDSFERMIHVMGPSAQFVRLPSTNGTHFYTGLIMAAGAWVPWPDNLTDDELMLYEERYGRPPDIFTPNYEEKVKIVNRIRTTDE
jgi:hypothetical protein